MSFVFSALKSRGINYFRGFCLWVFVFWSDKMKHLKTFVFIIWMFLDLGWTKLLMFGCFLPRHVEEKGNGLIDKSVFAVLTSLHLVAICRKCVVVKLANWLARTKTQLF